MASSTIKQVPHPLQGDLRQLIVALINRSPEETAYYLRQTVLVSTNPDTKRLFRKVLDELPVHLRGKLRDLINNPEFSI